MAIVLVICCVCVYSYWFSLYAIFTCSMCFFVRFRFLSIILSAAHTFVYATFARRGEREKSRFQMSLCVNRWICGVRHSNGHRTPPPSKPAVAAVAAMAEESAACDKNWITYSHGHFVHFAQMRCDTMQWAAHGARCKCAKSRVQLHHLFVLSTNLFPWICYCCCC